MSVYLKYFGILLMCCQFSVQAFMNSPQVIQSSDDGYQAKDTRKFEGIPSLAISGEDNLWSVWYAGITPHEDQNNYVVVAKSTDDGKSWNDSFIIDPDGIGPVRAYDPEVWLDPQGKLWVFWAQTIGHNGTIAGVWAMTSENPNDKTVNWSKPRRLTDGVMMCKPTVLSDGTWILPASTWKDTDNSAKIVVSTDNGKTFEVRGSCNVPVDDRDFDEHMIIERKDSSLWMLIRTKYGIGECISLDKGKTWSDLKPSNIQHPAARFFIRRLNSGNLLLVKHGAIEEKIGRSHLMAFISKDDGKTWQGGLLLDERKGVSYPDGQQTADGSIYITYDYSRRKDKQILVACFTEEDAATGKQTSNKLRLEIQTNKSP